MYVTCSIQWLCNGCASTHSRLPLVWRPIRRVRTTVGRSFCPWCCSAMVGWSNAIAVT